jgi:hypothetical protein
VLAERGHTAILVATSAAEKGLVEGLPPALCNQISEHSGNIQGTFREHSENIQ